MSKIITMSNK